MPDLSGPDAPVNSKYHWAYRGPEGPEFWHVHYKDCAGDRQSPINILTSSSVYDPTLEPIVLGNFHSISGVTGPCVLNVTNNGHAASIRVTGDEMWIQGGGLGQKYKTVEFHFHWGSTDDLGSEHAVNGRKYPLEMHVVNFAEKYGTVKQAMTQPDGLAVLGVFFELSDKDNPNFGALDEALRHVHKAGEHTIVNQLILRSLLPEDLSKFWRYNGSLTTPFCFETVTWTVFAEPLKISKLQLETLRSLLHEEEHDMRERGKQRIYSPSRLLENWRPLQALNGRVIKRSFIGTGRGPFLNRPVHDARIPLYEMSVPALSNFDDASTMIVGGSNLNVDPLIPPSYPTSFEFQKTVATNRKIVDQLQGNNQKDKMQSQILSQNKQDGHRHTEASPDTAKYFISKSGSGFKVENSSDIHSNLDSFRRSDSKKESLPAEELMFSQIRRSNLAADSVSGPLVIQSTNGADNQGKSMVSSEFQKEGQLMQGIKVGKTSTELQGNFPSSTGASSAPHNLHVDSRNQPLILILSSPSPQAESIFATIRPNSQHKQKQHKILSQNMNLNSRVGTMDSRIAELANQIRLHRHHGHAQYNQQNKSQPIIISGSRGVPMPPVIRHTQGKLPTAYSQQNRFYAQSSQRNSLMQQRQQILQMNRPPTPQQLRAILERLAATNRIRTQPPIITSGAASVPQGGTKDPNSLRGSARNIIHQKSQLFPGPATGSQQINNNNGYFRQIHEPQPVFSLPQSSWMQPATNEAWNYQNYPGTSMPDLYWAQRPQQHQHLMRNDAYQQKVQNQPQQQFISPDSSIPNYGLNKAFQESGHGAFGTNIPNGPYVPSPRNSQSHIYLNNVQHPARIRRPVFEQPRSWGQTQYYIPTLPYFL